MDTTPDAPHSIEWYCQRCRAELKPCKTTVTYLGVNFEIDLPRCPVCGQFFIGKELAEGKMRDAEMLLEDK